MGRNRKGRGYLRRTLTLALFLALVLLSLHVFPVNVTASMPYGIYMRLPPWRIEQGDLVELRNPLDGSAWGVFETGGLVKRVRYVSKDGLLYVMGEHELSYDSRYFGYIGREYVEHRLVPVLTFSKLPAFMAKEMKDEKTD